MYVSLYYLVSSAGHSYSSCAPLLPPRAHIVLLHSISFMEQSFSTVRLSLGNTNRGEGKGWLLRLLLAKLNIEHTSAGLHMLSRLFHESNAVMVVDCSIFMIAYCELVLSMLHVTQKHKAQKYNVVTMLFSKPVLCYSFLMLHSVPDLSLHAGTFSSWRVES